MLADDTYRDGRWLQRMYIGDKYTWTVSGVLWNNVKERTTPNSSTQKHEPTYINAVNEFESFQTFVEWNRSQIGYAKGYDLDSDILKQSNKCYSPDTCLLIPPALNRFLQSRSKKRSQNLPMGVLRTKNGKFIVRNIMKDDVTGKNIDLLYRYVPDIDTGMRLYAESVKASRDIWIDRLKNSGRYEVDNRVIDYLNNWEFVDKREGA